MDGTDLEDGEPSAWGAMRAAASALVDDFGRFFVASAAWMVLALGVVVLGQLHPLLNLVVLVMVPATSALGRMAAYTVHGRRARLQHAVEGITLRWRLKLALGGGQILILLLAWINIELGLATDRMVLVIAAVASANVAVVVLAAATMVWPLLLDPARDEQSARSLARLGLATLVLRPGRSIIVLIVEAALVVISLQTVVGALVLVSFGLLLAAHAAVPTARHLELAGPGRGRPGRG